MGHYLSMNSFLWHSSIFPRKNSLLNWPYQNANLLEAIIEVSVVTEKGIPAKLFTPVVNYYSSNTYVTGSDKTDHFTQKINFELAALHHITFEMVP